VVKIKRAPDSKKTEKVSEGLWELKLYVAGRTPKSQLAFANLDRICREHLAGRYRIDLIDLLKNPQMAKGEQILAIPTLVRKLPGSLRRTIIGDFTNTERVLAGLGLCRGC
jgi:circadian clock protein KaiB